MWKKALMQIVNVQVSVCISAIWSDILYLPTYTTISFDLLVDNTGTDQPVQMHRLIWACVVRKLHIMDPFHASSIVYICNTVNIYRLGVQN